MRPRTLTLWVDVPEAEWRPTPGIRSLMARGLSVRFSDNFGPHTKYFPHCNKSDSPARPLVTADDDILYPSDWLSSLLRAATASRGEMIVAHRAHHIELDHRGNIASYMDWSRQQDAVSSARVFATGVSGVFYPVRMLEALRDFGEAFLEVCPKADDIWLHAVALRTRIPVRQAAARPRDFLSVPNTQSGGLGVSNAFSDGNDHQIRRTYSASDLKRLREDGT